MGSRVNLGPYRGYFRSVSGCSGHFWFKGHFGSIFGLRVSFDLFGSGGDSESILGLGFTLSPFWVLRTFLAHFGSEVTLGQFWPIFGVWVTTSPF